MPDRRYDVQETRRLCGEIRSMKEGKSHQKTAFASLRKQLNAAITENFVGVGVPCTQADEALDVYEEFLKLFVELHSINRRQLRACVTVYYGPTSSPADVVQWNRLKQKYSSAPYRMEMSATCLIGSQASVLDDQLKPKTTRHLNREPEFVLEPYWSDIVAVLETADVCHIRNHSGVIKYGQPPRYCWKATPDLELVGTTDPRKKPMHNLGPCRNLMCPTDFVDKTRKCSRCKQATYCSADCQKAHWPLHKKQCKVI